jgi:hypothetical protein
MQLIRQLSNEELTEMLLDGDQRELQPALGSLPDWLHAATDQPEWFWQRQGAAIRGRIAAADRSRFRASLAWAGTLALSAVAMLLLSGDPKPTPTQTQIDPDQEMLLSVEDAVHRNVPAALEPAALLADEISNGARAEQTSYRPTQGESR